MKLLKHQEEISEKAWKVLLTERIIYLAMEVRTGKTITALETINKVIDTKPPEQFKVLFLTKKKAMASILGDFEAMGYKYQLMVLNYESAHKVNSHDFDFIVCDESQSLGTYPKPSKRHKDVKNILKANKHAGVIFMTGTPSPESYSQMFHQLNVSPRSPWKEYVNFYAWAKHYVKVTQKRLGHGVVNDYSDANYDKISADIAPYMFTYTQDQAGFEQTINEYVINVDMLQSTANLISKIKKDKVYELKNGEVILADTAVKCMQKVHQLGSGTVLFESGEYSMFDDSKIRAIKENFSDIKIAIMYIFKAEGEMLKKEFDNWTDSPEVFRDDQNKTFIGQIISSREGVDLSSADALVMYNIQHSALSYLQGRDRLTKIDRTKPNNVYWLFSTCGIEKDIYKVVQSKENYTTKHFIGKDNTEQNKTLFD